MKDTTDYARDETAALMRRIVGAIPALVSYVDRNGVYQFVNAAYSDWFGLPASAICGRTLRQVLGEDAWRMIAPHLEEALAGKTVKFQSTLAYRLGGTRDVEAQYIPDRSAEGAITGVFVYVRDVTDRKRAEDALTESERRFRFVADSAPAPMWMTDETGRIVFVNARTRALFGNGSRRPPEQDWRAFVHPDDLERAEQIRSEALKGRPRAYSYTARFQRTDGAWRLFSVIANPRFDEADRFKGYVGLGVDETEMRAAIEALAESEARFREVANSTPTPVWMTNESGAMIFANAQFTEMTGMSSQDAGGDGWKSAVHPDDLPIVEAARKEARSGEPAAYTFSARFRRRDGAWRWMEASSRPRRSGDGRFRGYIGMAVDRTEAVIARQALEESEARFRSLADHASVMTYVLEPDGRCSFRSETWREFTGEAAPLSGRGWLAQVHEGDRPRVIHMMKDAFAKETGGRVEYRLRRADGDHRWVIDAFRPRLGEGKEFRGFVGSVIDIHERKKMEEQSELLIRELSHRVKNMLAVVQSVARQSLRNPGDAAEGTTFEARLAAIARAHDLLVESQWSNPDLGEIVRATLFDRQDRISIKGPPVPVSPSKAVTWSMAFHELLTNSIKYGALRNPRGRVNLEWSSDEGGVAVIWREIGGPRVSPPVRKGFGTRLLEDALPLEFRGRTILDYAPEGLVCTIEAKELS